MATKKISRAWQRTNVGPGSGNADDEAYEGPQDISPQAGIAIVEHYFGKGREVLFFCYDFISELHVRPQSFDELFEFLKHSKVKGIFKQMALAMLNKG